MLGKVVALLLLSGCAGGTLNKIEGGHELPKELKERFEVREVPPEAVEQPKLAQAEASGEKKGRKKTKAKSAKASKTAAVGFAYPNRRPSREPIWIGEKQVYNMTYLGMSAGDVTLEVLPHKMVGSRKVYHARATAVSSSIFSLFYRLNDVIETFLDYQGIFSHRFHILLDETKQIRDSLELFDSEKGETFYWNKWNRKEKGYVETKETFPISPFSQDSFSALYYLRTQDLPDGAVIKFPVVSEGKSWEAEVTVVRREMMSTPMGKIQTVVLKPETKYQGILQKRGDSFLWLTDDDRKFLVRLEAKVKIGTVVASLKQVEPGTAPGEQKPEPKQAP